MVTQETVQKALRGVKDPELNLNIIDLGLMINWAISWGALSLGAWPIFVAPVAALSLLFVAVNLINIGLEEIYNPRLRGTAGA